MLIASLVILNVALQILDGVSTWMGLRKPHAAEGNAIANRLMQRFGVAPTLVVMKGLGIVLTLFAATIAYGVWLLVIMAVVNLWVVGDNFRIALKSAAPDPAADGLTDI
jgi:hypothetical protein